MTTKLILVFRGFHTGKDDGNLQVVIIDTVQNAAYSSYDSRKLELCQWRQDTFQDPENFLVNRQYTPPPPPLFFILLLFYFLFG